MPQHVACAALALLLCARAAAADLGGAVALVQDSVRVRSRESAAPSSSEWWVFGRHRRAREQQHEEVAPFTFMPLKSYGEAEEQVAQLEDDAQSRAALHLTEPAGVTPSNELKEKLVEKLEAKEQGEKEPKAMEFKVGESVQIMDMEHSKKGNATWVGCSVTGVGSTPGTYNVFIAAAPEGKQDYANIPAALLRRPPPPYRYKVGDVMRLRIASGPKAGAWVPCKITSKGKDEDTYRVHVPLAPPGHQDFDAIPALALMPAEADAEEYASLEKMVAATPNFAEHAAAFEKADLDYAVGEAAEVKIASGPEQGNWVPCTITGRGSAEYTYNISAGGQDFSNIHVIVLRKAAARAAQQEAPVVDSKVGAPIAQEAPVFTEGDVAEVLVVSGPNAGSWIKVSVKSKGDQPGTYNIDTGIEEFKNVPANRLRRNDNASAWDV